MARMVTSMVQKGYPVPMVLLVHANRLPIDDVMPVGRYHPRTLLHPAARVQLHRLINRRRHVEHTRALHKGRELDHRSDLLAGGPRLVRDHDAVHQLLGPGILDLERLLVLECLRSEAAQDGDRTERGEVAVRDGEARADHSCAQLVVHGRATQRTRGDRRREGAADLELEGEKMTPCLQCVGM